MSTTELQAHEARLTDQLIHVQEQGWREGAATPERRHRLLGPLMAEYALADVTADTLEDMSDEEFDQFLAA